MSRSARRSGHGLVVGPATLQAGDTLDVRADGEPPVRQQLQLLIEAVGEPGAVDPADAVAHEGQRPRGSDARVQLAQAAGGGVARVHERLVPLAFQPFVEFVETRTGQHHLAPDLDELRRIFGGQPQRQIADGARVGRDVLAGDPVAAGRRAHHDAGLETQIERRAVEFRLGAINQFVDARPLAGPSIELGQLIVVEAVRQRQHRRRMVDRLEGVHRRCADALGWRIGRDERRIFGLQRFQLAEQPVVLGVRDGRLGLDVIGAAVLGQIPCELLSALPLGRRDTLAHQRRRPSCARRSMSAI